MASADNQPPTASRVKKKTRQQRLTPNETVEQQRLTMIIGERLRSARVAANMSQTTLGQRLGLSFQQIQKYEVGANRISLANLLVFCRLMGISIAKFLEGIETLPLTVTEPQLENIESSIADNAKLVRLFSRLEDKTIRDAILRFVAVMVHDTGYLAPTESEHG